MLIITSICFIANLYISFVNIIFLLLSSISFIVILGNITYFWF